VYNRFIRNKHKEEKTIIIRSRRKTIAIQVTDKGLIVRAPYGVSRKRIMSFVESRTEWIEKQLKKQEEYKKSLENIVPLTTEELHALADQAKAVIPERVRYYAPMIGVQYGRITIRNQRTKWGSCSAKGNLNFNCLLMLAPPEVIDSVVVHELCHLKEMNHSKRFYEEILKVYPEYKKWDRWLKDNGRQIMARQMMAGQTDSGSMVQGE